MVIPLGKPGEIDSLVFDTVDMSQVLGKVISFRVPIVWIDL